MDQKLINSPDKPWYYLKLSEPLKFEAVSRARLNNVFFDECNNQVFSVQSGDMTEVVVKCPDLNAPRTFQMQEKGPVISIKFNPAQNILAVQRTQSHVEFINFQDGSQSAEYSQSCKSKNGKILGFIWMSATEIMFVTDQGVELYLIDPVKSSVKMTKSLAITVNWFLFCHRTNLLLLSSGTNGNIIQPIHLKQGNIHKLSRFEIEPPTALPKAQKLMLEERDAMVGIIYGQPRVIVLRHLSSKTDHGAEVIIYTIQKMSTVKKTEVLKLGRSGRFALSIVDNLIFVHHQASKTSLMFDIGLTSEFDGYHQPVMPPQPIRGDDVTQLYSSNWIMFPLNIVIDAKIGCLWHLVLELDHVSELAHSKSFLIEFLMLRFNSKEIILRVLREMTQNTDQNLEELAAVFDKINYVYRNHLLKSVKWQLGSPVSGSGGEPEMDTPIITQVAIDQLDMYTNVLSKMAELFDENSVPRKRKFTIWVLMEYIRSLANHQIPVQHFLQELVINSLVRHRAYYQLHQLLQYHVVSDSKPLACLLLSLENLYPAAHQLALDMLQRLTSASQVITEVLLSKQQIIPALRYTIESGNEEELSARKFLELAQKSGDRQVFYAVSNYFENRTPRANVMYR